MVSFMEIESKAVLIIYIGEVTIGFLAGWASPTISKLQSAEETPLSVTIDDEQASLLGATIVIGLIFGPDFSSQNFSLIHSMLFAFSSAKDLLNGILFRHYNISAQFSGFLSNVKGRRYCLIIGGLTCSVSFFLLAVSTELWLLMLGRTLLGVGAGPVYILNLTYITEVSSKNNRGVFLTGIGTANAIGLVFVYSIGPYISYTAMNFVGLLISATFTAGLLCTPETPVFNVMKGNDIKAKKTLLQLGRSEEIEDVLSVATSSKKHPCSSFTAIVSTRSNRKAFLIAAVLLALQQLSGRLSVILFGTSIFKSTGSTISPALATIGVGVSELVASCLSPVIAGKAGRKPMMLVSNAVCCLSLGTLGFFFYMKSIQPQLAEELYWLPLLSLVIFLLSYSLGFGIIPNTWMSEMLDSNARGPGSAVSLSISWIFCFITTSSFGYMTTILGSHWTFWIYALACAIAFIFTAVVVPETRGKTLTEIQHMLSK